MFTLEDHLRLNRILKKSSGFVMVSYNDCGFVRDLYEDFMIFHTKRPNSMSQTEGSEYEELVITNYDPSAWSGQTSLFGLVPFDDREFTAVHVPKKLLKTA